MKLLKIILLYLAFTAPAFAHGDEDHGEGKASATPAAQGSAPRLETSTESFELVSQLQGGVLTLVIDRYETNEPVLNGKVEAELNGQKAVAQFRPEQGDYVVNDPAFVNALAKPGKHAIVFTITASDESDLLEGTIQAASGSATGDQAKDHDHPGRFAMSTWAIGGALLAVLLAVAAISMTRRKSSTGK